MMHKILALLLILLLSPASSAFSLDDDSPRMSPIVKLVEKISPSVVNISTERIAWLKSKPQWGKTGQALDKMYQKYVQTYQQFKLPSVGSGVIINKEGLILTNAHVVDRAGKIYVTFHDGSKAEGAQVGINRVYDLAVIKINVPFELNPIEFGNSDDILVGETVMAIGNPFGLSSTVTTGIISAPKRNFTSPEGKIIFRDLIQTDTAINPGSSGGALINMEGKLIGMNQVIAQEAQGISFAIAANTIKTILPEFINYYEKIKAENGKKTKEQPK